PPEHHAPRALRLTLAAVLAQELQMAADDRVELPRVERGADDVEDLGARVEEHLPARLAEPVAPVDLLAHQEEVLVEPADRVHGLSPHEHARTEQVLRLARRLVVELLAEERVQSVRPRAELAQEEVLGRDPPRA